MSSMRTMALRVYAAAVAVLVGAGGARAAEVAFRDDFDGPDLDSGWSFVREDAAQHSLSARPGYFRINTQLGAFGEDSTIRNLLLREVGGDFILDARLEFDPQTPQQFAGLVAYSDDTHAVALGLVFVEGDRGQFRGVVLSNDGEGVDDEAPRPASRYDESNTDEPAIIFLRLLRKGDRFVGAFSSDGEIYKDVGTVTNPLPATIRAGVGAANAAGANCGTDCDVSLPADFDYFQISRLGDEPPDDPGVAVTLESVRIEGPDQVQSGSTAEFTATARYSDGTESEVSDEAEWLVSPAGLGTISEGMFSAASVSEARQATVVATFAQLTSGGEITRSGAQAVRITVRSTAGGGGSGGIGCGAGVGSIFLPMLGAALLFSRYLSRRVD